ncbi:hypothetical protein K438DRAFT_1761851 [Mycena galopus ATCC 62051]|nr:hypothetical protein K438DRAFT_1761851 [Mycena galopus ATCC 62051]
MSSEVVRVKQCVPFAAGSQRTENDEQDGEMGRGGGFPTSEQWGEDRLSPERRRSQIRSKTGARRIHATVQLIRACTMRRAPASQVCASDGPREAQSAGGGEAVGGGGRWEEREVRLAAGAGCKGDGTTSCRKLESYNRGRQMGEILRSTKKFRLSSVRGTTGRGPRGIIQSERSARGEYIRSDERPDDGAPTRDRASAVTSRSSPGPRAVAGRRGRAEVTGGVNERYSWSRRARTCAQMVTVFQSRFTNTPESALEKGEHKYASKNCSDIRRIAGKGTVDAPL